MVHLEKVTYSAEARAGVIMKTTMVAMVAVNWEQHGIFLEGPFAELACRCSVRYGLVQLI